jgi:hypothetical protein
MCAHRGGGVINSVFFWVRMIDECRSSNVVANEICPDKARTFYSQSKRPRSLDDRELV